MTELINFSNLGLNTTKIDLCRISGTDLSTECLYKMLCPQFNSYFINMGVIIIVSYIVISWFLWWFMKYGYKHFKYDKNSDIGCFLGDLDKLETRIYWDSWVRARLSKLMLGYIVIAVYLSII